MDILKLSAGIPNFDYVTMLPECEAEIIKIVDRSGQAEVFTKQYRARLKFLCEKQHNCHNEKPDWFECLGGSEGLFAMRFVNKQNIRVLFCFALTPTKAVFLHAFMEKDKKDYPPAIAIADSRRKMLAGGK